MTPQAQTRKDRTNAGAVDKLQHRHYAVIAGIINQIEAGMRADIANHFAGHLARNPRFDRGRFIRACLEKGTK